MCRLCTCTQWHWLDVARHADGCQLQLELRATGYWLVNVKCYTVLYSMSLTLMASPEPVRRVQLVMITVACLWSPSRGSTSSLYDEKVSSLGETASLHCSNSTSYPAVRHDDDMAPLSWMLPDLTVLRADQGRFQLLDHNWTLRVTNVTGNDLGIYRCLLGSHDDDDVQTWLVLRVGLNAGGPYFHDAWYSYRSRTVGGLSASLSFLLVSVIVYVVHRVRCDPRVVPDQSMSASAGELADCDSGTAVRVVSASATTTTADMNIDCPQTSSTQTRTLRDTTRF